MSIMVVKSICDKSLIESGRSCLEWVNDGGPCRRRRHEDHRSLTRARLLRHAGDLLLAPEWRNIHFGSKVNSLLSRPDSLLRFSNFPRVLSFGKWQVKDKVDGDKESVSERVIFHRRCC